MTRLRSLLLTALVAAVGLALPSAQVQQLAHAAGSGTHASLAAAHASYLPDSHHLLAASGDAHAAPTLQLQSLTPQSLTPPTPLVRRAAGSVGSVPLTLPASRAQAARAPPSAL